MHLTVSSWFLISFVMGGAAQAGRLSSFMHLIGPSRVISELDLWRLRRGWIIEDFRYFCSSVWEFYHYRRELMASKLPNPAHLAIAACEHRWRQENRSAAVLMHPIRTQNRCLSNSKQSDFYVRMQTRLVLKVLNPTALLWIGSAWICIKLKGRVRIRIKVITGSGSGFSTKG